MLLDFSKANDKVPHIEVTLQAPSLWSTRTPTQLDPEFPVGSNAESTGRGTFSFIAKVLGPLLFMAYKNDLSIRVGSSARLFADDYLLYKSIETKADGNNSNVTSTTSSSGNKTG